MADDFGQSLLRSHCYALERATSNTDVVLVGAVLTDTDRRNLELARERIDRALKSQEKIHEAA